MVTIVLLFLAAIWVAIALLCRRVKPLPGEMGRITEKLPLTKAGLIACGFCAAVAVGMLLVGDKQAPLLAALAVLSAGLVHLGCIPCLRWNAEGFVYRNAWGRSRHYAWQDDMHLTSSGLDRVLHIGRQRIVLPSHDADCTAFLREMKARRMPDAGSTEG